MNRFLYTAFVACIAGIVSIWLYAALIVTPPQAAAEAADEASLRTISKAELARHDHAESCWKAIDGLVYDFTDYIPEHPTPPAVMLRWCGKEASEAYHTKGYGSPHSPAADAMLPDYLIGRLETNN